MPTLTPRDIYSYIFDTDPLASTYKMYSASKVFPVIEQLCKQMHQDKS